MTKLCILISHPIQYFSPVFSELSKSMEVDTTVVYRTRVGLDAFHDPGFGRTMSWDIPLLDGYKSEFLSSKLSLNGIEWNVIAALWRLRPDVLLIHGYNHPTNIIALLFAKLIGAKVLMRGDTRTSKHHAQSGFKHVMKKALFKLINGFLAIGRLNKVYYQQHGVPESAIYFAPFAVNNAHFSNTPAIKQTARMNWLNRVNADPDSVLLFTCAKLITRKRTQDAILAHLKLNTRFPNAHLIIAGTGSEEQALRNLVLREQCTNIHFVGFLNQSELPELYAACDVFVFPSEDEPWGLGLNEIMAAGLPAVVSDDVGAAPDLVVSGKTGYMYPMGNIDQLVEKLITLVESEEKRSAMGVNAKKLIAEWNIDKSAEGIVSSCNHLQ
jgi:glycosyltransferase involved in cell wall biosynthesis